MALYRLVASGTTPGETFSFTMHAEANLSTGAAATAFGDALTACWAAGMDDLTTPEVALTLASAAAINEATDGQITHVEVVLALTGGAEAQMLAFQCPPRRASC